MRIDIKQLLLIAILPLLICCSNKKNLDNIEDKIKTTADRVAVSGLVIEPQVFRSQLLANGKLEAIKKIVVKSEVSGDIERIAIKEGSYVRSGTQIILFDTVDIALEHKSAVIALEKAKLEYKSQIIGQGYSINDKDIPQEIVKISRLKSGVEECDLALQKSKIELKKSSFRAPFSGLIANLKVKAFTQVNVGEELFSIIDASKFETVFSLLETEIDKVDIGDSITVTPMSSERKYFGVVTSITPCVDENGMVTVRGMIKNVDGKLLEGLNVKVILEKQVAESIVVPNESILLRQNKKVVFTCEDDSIAIWNYVTIGQRNSTHSTLVGDDNPIKRGDTIIYRNNLHLAHEAVVDLNITNGTDR